MALAPSSEPVVAQFTAKVQATKNRHVAIPAEVRRQAGLSPAGNEIVHVSIRPAGSGHWNHHYFKVTKNGCLAIPTDICSIAGGDMIEVKIHRPEKDSTPDSKSAAAQLLDLVDSLDLAGWRTDGSVNVDKYLNEEMLK